MKLTKSELKKLIMEVITEESLPAGNEDLGSISKDEQNKIISDLIYEYLEKFCQAPEDKSKLESTKFGHRKNNETANDSYSKKILDMKNEKIDYVYCFFHPRHLERIFNLNAPQAKNHGGSFLGISSAIEARKQNILKRLNDIIDYAKRKSGFNSNSIKMSIGVTSNTRKYHGKENDNSVYYIYRVADK